MTPTGEGREQRTVTDPRAMRRVDVDGITESLTTSAMTPRAAEQYLVRPGGCGARPGAPRLTVAGYEGVQVIRENPAPSLGGTMRFERWFATGLDCLELKSALYWPGPDGQARLAKETVVTSVAVGEPDSALFAIPASYIERSPSAVFAEFERRYPSVKKQPCEAPDCNDAGTVLDRAYYAQRPR
ncbi:MAG: hypothetical protein IT159_04360 [Bryobacterales bacterium]|nr:hypothetical protein [Bryobacterales bacterium]